MMSALRERRQERRSPSAEGKGEPKDPGEGSRRWPRGDRMPEDAALLWYLDADGELEAVPVRTGLSDGQSTQIEEAGPRAGVIEPGLQIIAAVTGSSQTSSSNPFQSQQQSRPPGPPGAGF